MSLPKHCGRSSCEVCVEGIARAMEKQRVKVTWEMVSAVSHPQFYNGESPAYNPDKIPDEYWKTIISEHASMSQYRGLMDLVRAGEYIRNVRLYVAETNIVWKEVTPDDNTGTLA